ncbi:hypothetical protein V492_06853 [Pseudogymnoascus sp. VKM F-4246]|nr:hypothetical protein V492_06853 [Pseudogymnoascus sp. VKM F-4246]
MPTRSAILSMPSPLPAPRRSRYACLPRSLTSLALLAICLTFTFALASRPPTIPDTLVPPAELTAAIARELAELEAKGIVLLDTRPPPLPKVASDWDLDSFSGELLRRGFDLLPRKEDDEADDDEESTTAAPSKTTTRSPSSSHTSTHSSSTSSSASSASDSVAIAAPTTTSAPLPEPFDSNLGGTFQSPDCPLFINSFLATAEFKGCYAVSLLFEVCPPPPAPLAEHRANPLPLQSSHSFFETIRSPFLTTALLDHSCAAPSTCAPYLSSLAATLNTTCAADLAVGNSMATMALTGLLAYPSLRTATCLKSSTGSYCFADATTNSTSDEDSYVYYMGVGHSLPSTTKMTCNTCLRDVVGVFGAAAANRTVPVSKVYAEGAGVVNSVCGAGWVNETLPSAFTGAAVAVAQGAGSVVGVVVALVAAVLLV